MGLFSFFRKDKQQSSASKSDFYSQADEEKPAARKRRQGTKRDEPVDPVLPEKKRARRRLIGAVALVLAAVIGLPMILDSEPKPLSDDIAIQIPSKDAATPVSSGKPVGTGAHQAPEGPQALAPNEEVIDTPPAAQEKAPAPAATQPTPAAPPTPAATAPSHDAGKKPHSDTAKSDDSETRSTTSSAAATKKADDARARAILEGKSPTDTTTKPAGKVSLQVAALASQDKVNELQKKLQGAGLKSYTQKVATESGERIRVRVGPFPNDAEAEKARAKLGKIGLTGKLVPA